MVVHFEVIPKAQITDSIRRMFAEKLKRQGKVKGPLQEKADRCKWLCLARVNNEVVGVGAIKPGTESEFSDSKAGLADLSGQFEWALGYLFVEPAYRAKGIGKRIAYTLVETYGDGNLMVSAEVFTNPATARINEALGFRHHGKFWRSSIHKNYLGLFLKWRASNEEI